MSGYVAEAEYSDILKDSTRSFAFPLQEKISYCQPYCLCFPYNQFTVKWEVSTWHFDITVVPSKTLGIFCSFVQPYSQKPYRNNHTLFCMKPRLLAIWTALAVFVKRRQQMMYFSTTTKYNFHNRHSSCTALHLLVIMNKSTIVHVLEPFV